MKRFQNVRFSNFVLKPRKVTGNWNEYFVYLLLVSGKQTNKLPYNGLTIPRTILCSGNPHTAGRVDSGHLA